MKKALVWLLLAPLLLLACENRESPQSRSMADRYVFRSSDGRPLSDSPRDPIKTNPVSGAATHVCIDPLCSHDSTDCPLFGIQSALVGGDKLYYVTGGLSVSQYTGEKSGRCEIRSYDMRDGAIDHLASGENDIVLLGAYRDAVYFMTAIREEENERFRYALFRSDGKKTVELPLSREYQTVGGGMSTADFPLIYAFDGDRILWYAPGENGIDFYATDLNGVMTERFSPANPRIMNGHYADGFAYYAAAERRPEGADEPEALFRRTNSREIRRCRLDGSGEATLCGNAAAWILAGDTIYYTVLEEEPETFEFNDMKETNWLGGKIYAVGTDGSENRLLCSLEYDLDMTDTKTFLGALTEDGATYLCLAFRDYLPNNFYSSGYEYGLSPDTLIVNAATGEIRIVSAETGK